MPSVTQILIKEAYSKLPEVEAIKTYIRANWLPHFKIDPDSLEEAYDLSKYGISPKLMGNITDVVVWDFFRKKKGEDYAPKMFAKEIRFMVKLQNDFSNAIHSMSKGGMNPKHKSSLSFFDQKFYDVLKNRNTTYKSIPLQHYLLFARVSHWFRVPFKNLLSDVEVACKKFKSEMEDLTAIVPVIQERIDTLLKDMAFQDCIFGHAIGTHIVSGEADILIDDKMIDSKSIKNMKITIDWLFQLFFYAFLHHEIKNLKGHEHKIKQFGFLNWRCNCFHIKTCEFSTELTELFRHLYQRIGGNIKTK